jgi:hypothetical protein
MLFTINNKHYLSTEQLRANTLLDAYYSIKSYPMHAADLVLDKYIQQQYNMSLKNLCIKLLIKLSFYTNEDNNLVLLFKDPKDDKTARLVTYGNGAIPGSKILQTALGS